MFTFTFYRASACRQRDIDYPFLSVRLYVRLMLVLCRRLYESSKLFSPFGIHYSSFLNPPDVAEFQVQPPQRGAKNTWGVF